MQSDCEFIVVIAVVVVVLCVHVKFGHDYEQKQGGGIHTLADGTPDIVKCALSL